MTTRTIGRHSVLFGLVLAAASTAWAAGSWQQAGPMSFGRWAPTATALLTGKVLVAGGYDGTQTVPSAQLFDPATNLFTETGPLYVGRNFAAATLLGNGKVLVAGGFNAVAGSMSDAALYDPLTGLFRPTLGTMYNARELFSATKLPNGKVLLAGGFDAGSGTLRGAELYDPATETFQRTGSLLTPYGRFGQDAVYLPTVNQVLVVGGKERRSNTDWRSLNTAELYDVATGKFTKQVTMSYRRDRPTVAWVSSLGKALVIGGKSEAPGIPQSDVLPCEWFNPATGTFSTGPSLAVGRMAHAQVALPDGSILVAGGWNVSLNRTTETAERFYPDATNSLGGAFVSAGSMADSRHDSGAALLSDGRVLIAGGKKVDQNPGGTTEYLNRAETYAP